MQTVKIQTVLMLAAALKCAAAQAAVSFNFEADFSAALNDESSTWSYRFQADGSPDNLARDGSYELLPNPALNIGGMAGFNGWQLAGGLPQVARNTTGATVTDGHTMFVPAGQSQLHPNPNQIVVVSWLAPASGAVRVDFRFTDLDGGCSGGVAWYVDKGDAFGNRASGVLANGGDSGWQTISSLTVRAGDRLNFVVDPNGDYYCDSTRLFAEISYPSFNLERDFSLTQNSDASMWSYRYQANGDTLARDGNYELLPGQTSNMDTYAGLNGWQGPGGYPEAALNTSGIEIVGGDLTLHIPAGQSQLHPGPGQIVVVSWLAPASGAVRVDYRFTDLNGGCAGEGDGVAWYVDKGDASGNLDSGILANGGDSGLQTLPSVTVTGGDRLNFIVAPNVNYVCDSTRLFAEIVSTGPPAIVAAGNEGNTAVQVVFTVPVQPVSATNKANYALTNQSGSVAIMGAAFGADTRTLRLTTASQLPYAKHWLTINNVADAASGTQIIAANSQGIYTNAVFNKGYVTRQLYLNLGSGTAVFDLTGSAKFPNSPDQVDYPAALGWPQENIADQYGGRMSGLLIAPASGQYFFALRSDDSAQLFFSTNGNPANKALLTQETACCNGFDAHVAGPVTLAAGQRCYIEALMKAGVGGDYLHVAWKTPMNSSAWTVIPGVYLGNFNTNGNASLTIVRQPTNTTVMASQPATFSIAATGASVITTNITCQWQVNGLDIPGAIDSTYTTPPVSEADHGAVYRALVSVPGQARFSSNAVLAVTPDLVPPTVVQVLNFGATSVQIIFSESVEPASATNFANYVFTNGLPVTAGTLVCNSSVMLATSPLVSGSNYCIVINRVRDCALAPNTIASNTLVSFTAALFTPATLGGATPPGSVISLTNGLDVSAGGSDIGGRSDQCEFSYQIRSGDFDVRVRLQDLAWSSPWAKAGLMARETLDPNSRFAASLATPGLMGCFFEARASAGALATMSGAFPANYPDTWMRLQRVGSACSGYASLDGFNWTRLGASTLTANPVYVGLAATSCDASQLTLARFRDFSEVTNASASAPGSPREPLGPSSRRTALSVSEIMYKPAPRADGQNLEYIELYNSGPYWEDLSAYRLTGDQIDFTFPSGTILQAGAFVVVAAAPASLREVYGITNVLGPYHGVPEDLRRGAAQGQGGRGAPGDSLLQSPALAGGRRGHRPLDRAGPALVWGGRRAGLGHQRCDGRLARWRRSLSPQPVAQCAHQRAAAPLRHQLGGLRRALQPQRHPGRYLRLCADGRPAHEQVRHPGQSPHPPARRRVPGLR